MTVFIFQVLTFQPLTTDEVRKGSCPKGDPPVSAALSLHVRKRVVGRGKSPQGIVKEAASIRFKTEGLLVGSTVDCLLGRCHSNVTQMATGRTGINPEGHSGQRRFGKPPRQTWPCSVASTLRPGSDRSLVSTHASATRSYLPYRKYSILLAP